MSVEGLEDYTKDELIKELINRTTFPPQDVPLRIEPTGAIRIGQTRVLLELVIRAFQDGATPEAIVQRYSSLNLADVYAVIAYYLRHRIEVEDYLTLREQQAAAIQEKIEARQGDLSEIRNRLAAQRRT
jgi:uncharacterized protein (DUF433 family)